MIDQCDPSFEDFHIKTRGSVAGLVRIHCDAGCKEYCRYAVVNENSLVRKTVEYFSECWASVIAQTKVEVDSVKTVAYFKVHLFSFR